MKRKANVINNAEDILKNMSDVEDGVDGASEKIDSKAKGAGAFKKLLDVKLKYHGMRGEVPEIGIVGEQAEGDAPVKKRRNPPKPVVQKIVVQAVPVTA